MSKNLRLLVSNLRQAAKVLKKHPTPWWTATSDFYQMSVHARGACGKDCPIPGPHR